MKNKTFLTKNSHFKQNSHIHSTYNLFSISHSQPLKIASEKFKRVTCHMNQTVDYQKSE